MISLYEAQTLAIQQNTDIFMELGYAEIVGADILTEGVISTIIDGIKAIFRKIVDLIRKFIGFITGQNRSSGDDVEKLEKTMPEVEKKTEQASKEIEKEIKKAEQNVRKIDISPENPVEVPVPPKVSVQDDKSISTKSEEESSASIKKAESSNDLLNTLKEYRDALDELNNGKKYLNVYLSDDITVNLKKPIIETGEIVLLKSSLKEFADILNNPSEISKFDDVSRDDMEDVAKENGYTNVAKVINDYNNHGIDGLFNSYQVGKKAGSAGMGVLLSDDIDEDRKNQNLISRTEFFKRRPTIEKAFRGFKNTLDKSIKQLSDELNGDIRPLANKFESLSNSRNKNDKSNHIYYIASKAANTLLTVYIERIKQLTSFNKLYKTYDYNMKIASKDFKKIQKLEERIKKLNKKLEKM